MQTGKTIGNFSSGLPGRNTISFSTADCSTVALVLLSADSPKLFIIIARLRYSVSVEPFYVLYLKKKLFTLFKVAETIRKMNKATDGFFYREKISGSVIQKIPIWDKLIRK